MSGRPDNSYAVPVLPKPKPKPEPAPDLPLVDPDAPRGVPELSVLVKPDQVAPALDKLNRTNNHLSLPPAGLKAADVPGDHDAPGRALDALDEETARTLLRHCNRQIATLTTTMARLIGAAPGPPATNRKWVADLLPLVTESSLLKAHSVYLQGKLDGTSPSWSYPTKASIELDLCRTALDLYLVTNPVLRILELVQSTHRRRARLVKLEAADNPAISAFLKAAAQMDAPPTTGWKPTLPPVVDLVAAIGHQHEAREVIARYRRDADECLAALPPTLAGLVAHVIDDVAGGAKEVTVGITESLLLRSPIGADEGEIREVEEELAELGATPKSPSGGKVVASLQADHARLTKASATRRAAEKSRAESIAASVVRDALDGDVNGYGRLALAATIHPRAFNPSVGEALMGVPGRLVAGHVEVYGRSIGFAG